MYFNKNFKRLTAAIFSPGHYLVTISIQDTCTSLVAISINLTIIAELKKIGHCNIVTYVNLQVKIIIR